MCLGDKAVKSTLGGVVVCELLACRAGVASGFVDRDEDRPFPFVGAVCELPGGAAVAFA